jgi:hypothetical protein
VKGHTIREGRGQKDPEIFGEVARQTLGDVGAAPQREVRTVLIERSDRKDQPRIAGEHPPDLRPRQVLQRV